MNYPSVKNSDVVPGLLYFALTRLGCEYFVVRIRECPDGDRVGNPMWFCGWDNDDLHPMEELTHLRGPIPEPTND